MKPFGFNPPRLASRSGDSTLTYFVQNIRLSWDANTEPDLAGYKLYAGTASGVYSGVPGSPRVMGNTTTGDFPIFTPGTYYFALTAYDTEDLESAFSNEVSGTWT